MQRTTAWSSFFCLRASALLRVSFCFACWNLAHRVVGAASACVRCEVSENWAAYLAACGETKSCVGVIECRLDPSTVKKVPREVLAAGRAHFVCFEERAAYPMFRVFAETVPRIGVGFCRSIK